MWHGVATGLSIQGDGFDPRIDRKTFIPKFRTVNNT